MRKKHVIEYLNKTLSKFNFCSLISYFNSEVLLRTQKEDDILEENFYIIIDDKETLENYSKFFIFLTVNLKPKNLKESIQQYFYTKKDLNLTSENTKTNVLENFISLIKE